MLNANITVMFEVVVLRKCVKMCLLVLFSFTLADHSFGIYVTLFVYLRGIWGTASCNVMYVIVLFRTMLLHIVIYI